jgi:hypothetical protein
VGSGRRRGVVAGAMAFAWAQWIGPSAPPGADVVAAAAAVVPAPPARPAPPPVPALELSPPPFISISATGPDKALVGSAVALLRRHGELAEQRAAEIRLHRLHRVDAMELSACDVCKVGPMTVTGNFGTINGRFLNCTVLLNTGSIGRQARRWQVGVTELVAMAVLHEQELCLRDDAATMVPADAERRFARKVGNGRLFDRFYAQIDAGARDRDAVERALAIVREHGELAYQRADALRRHRLNQVATLRITVCRSCGDHDRLGQASASDEQGTLVSCDILVDLAVVEETARGWGLPVSRVTAVLLAHEQEHCIRSPDDRETPAVDEEVRLASKIGGARLMEYVRSSYSLLDRGGHWKT